MLITLIGMPGCGKTTSGKLLSNKLGLPFYDLDLLIEKHSGFSISEIFKTGEAHFRKIESDFLANFFKKNSDGILACGGGTPCFFNNIEIIKKYSDKTIYLKTPVNILSERLFCERNERPLLNGIENKNDLEKLLLEILSKREDFYIQADMILEYPESVMDITF